MLKRRILFGTTVLAGLLTATAPAWAQTVPSTAAPAPLASQDDAAEVEEIVVTGSRIRRDPTTAPTALIQISGEQLQETGQNTIIDYLATIPALSNSQVPSDTVGSLNAGGLSLPNLRTLGAGRTLTLVNGRRHVGSQIGALSVDVDTIPRLLIQSTEIVTGGASSVYGADAVSGVLNFILREDFEGAEIDANYGMTNQDGQANKRISALIGKNFLDDRLNVYGYAEYEHLDEVLASDIDWLNDGWGLTGNDSDPTSASNDGVADNLLYRDRRTLQILRWGQVTLANSYQASPTRDPDITFGNCNGFTAAACYGVAPGSTYVFSGADARLANFGNWVSQTGTNRTINVGGDGENPNTIFNVDSTLPESEAARFQVGVNYKITPSINMHLEAKYVDETTNLAGGYTFNDVYISNTYAANNTAPILSSRLTGSPSAFSTRLDNAYLPANLAAAIAGNVVNVYGQPTANAPGALTGTRAAPYARYSAWGIDRPQTNERQLQRYVVSFDGTMPDFGPVRAIDWDIGYTYGRVDNRNYERSVDGERFSYALDAVRNAAGNIVCRAQLLTAGGGTVTDRNTGAQIGANDPDIQQCVPINIFGLGNQSEEALNYIRSEIVIDQVNEQQDVLATVAGRLWDVFGAGEIGVALGAEYRKEFTEGTGRDRTTAGRWLLSNTGPDFAPADYETREVFAEISLPLLRDSFLGEYAELSGSYRYSDFTTVGADDVYGVNFVYRPIRDITFKTSYNTSVRVPSLSENFAPATQTFAQITDPCDARNINGLTDRTIANQRIANCTAQARALGLDFTFDNSTAPDAFRPTYSSSVSGVNVGNRALEPEESNSFTFSTVLQPRFIPNLAISLDYYEIEIENVIAAVTAQTNSNNCVNGPSLNDTACSRVTRSGVDDPSTATDERFLLVNFVQDSVNYAKREVRGLDFDVRYRLDEVNVVGRNVGGLAYSLSGSYLIEQQNFNNIADPADFTESVSALYYPRVRFTSSLTWAISDAWSVNWTADWQTAQDIVQSRDFINNFDNRSEEYLDTGNFMRNDFTVRWSVREDLTLRAGVVNAFDEEQAPWLGGTLYSNFDPYGRRFFIGLNYRPW